MICGAQATGLRVSADCRDGTLDSGQTVMPKVLPAGLPATTG